jgi:hypothetical protein
MEQWPMDSEVLAQASTLRAELLAVQARLVGELQRDLEQATFFTTRGGFERVVRGVDELVQRYGENNLEDAAVPTALRDAARGKLAQLDAQSHDEQRKRLQSLEQAFREGNQEGLAQLVQRYREQYLPDAPAGASGGNGAPGGGDGNGNGKTATKGK